MNKAEIIKGINKTIEGLETIKSVLESTEVTTVAPKAVEEVVESKPVEEVTEKTVGKFDVEQLNSMKYNEFKKFAASLGVKCTGTRAEIMDRILALDVVIENGEAEVVDPVEEEPVVEESKSDNNTGSKRLGKKKVDEPARDEFDEQAERVAEDTDVEDIIEALADVDIKATKKNAVEKLAEALREGLIELEDEEDDVEEVEEEDVEEEEEEIEEVEETDDEDITAESYFAHLDPKGYNNPKGMTEERAEAIVSIMDEILTEYSEGNLSDEEVASYVEDNATQEEIDLLGDEYTDEDILKLYMELVKRTIDNDGEVHEQGEPYEVADKDLCCGHELNYIKKTKKYVCEHCGTEYEAE